MAEKNLAESNSLQGLWTLIHRDLKGWYKNAATLFLTLTQPVVWLALYGKAIDYGAVFRNSSFDFAGLNLPKQGFDSLANQFVQTAFGTNDYFSFLAAGMLAFIVLFGASFSGISVVFERRGGFLGKVLSAPVSRSVVVASKVLSSVMKSLVQAMLVLVIAVLLGMHMSHFSPLGLAGTFVVLFLLAVGLSSIFTMSALKSANWQLQLAVINFISLPLLFASNALFPAQFMPVWMQVVVSLNPMSYAADAVRQLLLGSTGMVGLQLDFGFLLAFALAFLFIGFALSRRYLAK